MPNLSTMFLSVVIAVYNEEENVLPLTERIYSTLQQKGIPFELIYVIDGDDRSYPRLQELQKTKKNLLLDYSPALRGFKKAFVQGFSMVSAKATHVVTLDADLNHRPEEIPALLAAMEKSTADIVIGSRYVAGGKIEKLPLWKHGISVFANFVIKLVWKIKLKDKTSGFRVYRKVVIDMVVPLCKSTGFEFLFEMLIWSRRKGYTMVEVPINFITREYGESKFNLRKTMQGYARLLWRDIFK